MKHLLIATAVLFSTAAAYAHGCPAEMRAIDAKLATNPTVAAADMEKVKALRAQAEQLHKEGKHTESMKALADAKKLLGL